jgi:hypothetical protein
MAKGWELLGDRSAGRQKEVIELMGDLAHMSRQWLIAEDQQRLIDCLVHTLSQRRYPETKAR